MSVTAYTIPPLLGAVRSPMDIELGGTNYRIGVAAKAIITITFLENVVTTDTITLDTPAGTVVFTCDGPDESGLQFAPTVLGVTAAANSFMQGCISNAFIAENYDITRIGAMVVLTARYPGSNYDLIGQAVAPPTRANVVGAYGGADVTYSDNYNIVVRPRIYTNSEWLILGEYPLVPGADTRATLDIKDLLYPYVDKPDWPPFQQFGIAMRHDLSFKPYIVELFERYGDPATERAITRIGSVAEPQYAWLAGWERPEWQTWTSFMARVMGTAPPHPFLTWRNRSVPRYVTKKEIHYLGWFHWPMWAEPEELELEARLTCCNPNGTGVLNIDWLLRYDVDTADTIPRGRISSFAVGYTQLDMDAMLPPGKVALKYSVRINDRYSGPKSEELTFWIAKENHNERYLWYVNSLGCVESLRTTGAWSRPEEHAHMQLHRPHLLADNYDTAAGEHSAFPQGAQRMLQVFTGYNKLTEHQAIMDILGSPGVREAVYGDTLTLLPLRFIETDEEERNKRGIDGELLHGMDLTFAADDPTALTTMNTEGLYVENEADADPEL